MLTADQTTEPEPIPPAPLPRSVVGTVWRTLVAIPVCLGVVAGAAWVGSKALELDGRLLEAPAAVPAFLVVVVGLAVLRARPWFAVVPALAADVAACAGAALLNDHLLSAGRLHLDTLGNRLVAGSLAAAVLITVLGLAVAAVSGHRHPRAETSSTASAETPPAG